MQHTIMELEDGALTLTVAEVGRTGAVLRSCMRMPIGELQGGTLAQTLRSLHAEMPEESARLHLLLGERRCHHFTLVVPQLPPKDLQALVVREALRVAGLPAGTPVLARGRCLKRLPGQKVLLGVTAMARSAYELLQKAFEAAGIEVASLTSIENGLAMAIAGDLPPRTAVLEYSAGRARFVLCENGAPVMVRRFLVAGLDQSEAFDPAVLGAQLAMEVPRTLDFLREQGHGRPDALLVSHRTGLGDGDLELLSGDVAQCRLAKPDWQVVAGQDTPGLATFGLLRSLAEGAELPSLLGGVTVMLPRARWPQVLAAGLLGLGLVGAGAATMVCRDIAGIDAQVAQLQAENDRLATEISSFANAAPAGETGPQRRLQQALGTRRPYSLLLAQLCNAAPATCNLLLVDFTRAEEVIVEGVVTGATRRQAVATLGSFVAAVRQLAMVVDDGNNEAGEGDAPNRLHFRFHLHWRRT
jgi:Tfp pilus assembly protein PilN